MHMCIYTYLNLQLHPPVVPHNAQCWLTLGWCLHDAKRSRIVANFKLHPPAASPLGPPCSMLIASCRNVGHLTQIQKAFDNVLIQNMQHWGQGAGGKDGKVMVGTPLWMKTFNIEGREGNDGKVIAGTSLSSNKTFSIEEKGPGEWWETHCGNLSQGLCIVMLLAHHVIQNYYRLLFVSPPSTILEKICILIKFFLGRFAFHNSMQCSYSLWKREKLVCFMFNTCNMFCK